MWRLIQDFFRQNWIMRGAIALGWLSILIMVTSAYVSIEDLMTTLVGGEQVATEDSVME